MYRGFEAYYRHFQVVREARSYELRVSAFYSNVKNVYNFKKNVYLKIIKAIFYYCEYIIV